MNFLPRASALWIPSVSIVSIKAWSLSSKPTVLIPASSNFFFKSSTVSFCQSTVPKTLENSSSLSVGIFSNRLSNTSVLPLFIAACSMASPRAFCCAKVKSDKSKLSKEDWTDCNQFLPTFSTAVS